MQPPMGYPTYPNPGYPPGPGYAAYPTPGHAAYPTTGHAAFPNSTAYANGGMPWIPPHLAADYSAGFGTAVKRTLSRAVRFRGMASRREFWLSYLAYWLLIIPSAASLGLLLWAYESYGAPLVLDIVTVTVLVVISVVYIISGLSLMSAAVRRLHDGGRSGAWILIAFVPVAGGIILLVLLAQETRPWLWRPEWVTG